MAKKTMKIDVDKIEKRGVTLSNVIAELKKLEPKGTQYHFLIGRTDSYKCEELLDEIRLELGKNVSAINGKTISIFGRHTVEVTESKFYEASVKNARAGYGAKLFRFTHLRKLK